MGDVLILIVLVTLVSYVFLIGILSYGVSKLQLFETTDVTKFNSFSIVVVFRDEAANLQALLNSLGTLNYPKSSFELILVNDFSSDNSVNLVETFMETHSAISMRLLTNEAVATSPKKEGLKKAIGNATYDWVLTTDADCVLNPNHLSVLNAFIQQHSCRMIVMPVVFNSDNSLLQQFQQLDLLSLMGATQGGFQLGFPFLCNGANLCFNKKTFDAVKGYEGNTNIASGDDVFLMEKFVKMDRSAVKYLKNNEVILSTQPQYSLNSFIQQRIRWAAKTTASKSSASKCIGLIVFATNLMLCVLPLVPVFSLKMLAACWFLKIAFDLVLLKQISKFYEFTIKIPTYLLFSFLYPMYASFIALMSLRKGYVWKGRYFLR